MLDALYGTDAIDESISKIGPAGESYNPARGIAVFKFVHKFLDETFPLSNGDSHSDVSIYSLTNNDNGKCLHATLKDGKAATLNNPLCFAGYQSHKDGHLLRYRTHMHELLTYIVYKEALSYCLQIVSI